MDGCTCPCCNQNAQAHRVTFNYAMGKVFEAFYIKNKKTIGAWLQTTDFPRDGSIASVNITRGVQGKLVYWGLLEKKEDEKAYRITVWGKKFVELGISIPRALWTYNNERLCYDAEAGEITFREALEK